MASSRSIPIAPLSPGVARALASPYLGLVLTTMIWGALHPLGKLAMRDVTPVQLILARVVFATVTLAAILALHGQATLILKELRGRPWTLLLLAVFSFLGSSGSSMMALSLLPASVSSLLSNTSPLFVALGVIALDLASRRSGSGCIPCRIGAMMLGIAVGFVGLALVVLGENAGGLGGIALNPLGVGLSLLGSFFWALYIGYGRQAMAQGNPLAVVAATGLFGSVPWLIVGGLTGDIGRLASLSPEDWGLLLFLGIVGTGVTYGLWTAALTRLSAASVAVFQYCIPFWAVILAVLLLGERVTIPLVIGGIGIIAGIAVTQRAARPAPRPAEAVAANSRT